MSFFSGNQNILFWRRIFTYFWSMLVVLILSLCRTKWSKKVPQCAVRGGRTNSGRGVQETGNLWPLEVFRAGLDRPWAFPSRWYCFEGWDWTKCLSVVPSQLNYSMSLWWINICMLNFSVILTDKGVTGVDWKEMDLGIYTFSLIRGLCIWPWRK